MKRDAGRQVDGQTGRHGKNSLPARKFMLIGSEPHRMLWWPVRPPLQPAKSPRPAPIYDGATAKERHPNVDDTHIYIYIHMHAELALQYSAASPPFRVPWVPRGKLYNTPTTPPDSQGKSLLLALPQLRCMLRCWSY